MVNEQEQFDFSNMSQQDVAKKLAAYDITLQIHEALDLQKLLQRPPTLTECILWSIEGSEHCSYKSSRTHLKQLPTTGPKVVIGAKEDAGVIEIAKDRNGEKYCLVISHESHNHPSQVVPFEGAATGVGGNVRDVCCMGAEVVAVADSLRFGSLNESKTHWITEGVVSGIASYANALGVPNLTGDVYFDQGYNDNCLVTVVTLGIVKEKEIIHSYAPENADGYDLILVGKPTDNTGFGGASFASIELDEDNQNRGAVQEPNAFLERHLLKSSYALFKDLKDNHQLDLVGFKDLGAGGVACASVELADAAGYGADVYIEDVFVGQENLHPSVILCSETQERFMWVCHPSITTKILQHYNNTYALGTVAANAQAKVVGKIRQDGQYRVHFHNQLLVDMKASDVTKGIVYDRDFSAPRKNDSHAKATQQNLLSALAHENIASDKPIYEKYDKQVQGRTIIERGEATAGVIQPFNSSEYPKEIQMTGVALATDACFASSDKTPYDNARTAVLNAIRKVAAVGATPQAITDCLCFGNPEKPEQMYEFVEAVRAIADTCKLLEIPVVAGNVSFYNETQNAAIPASPMISCVGVLDDVTRAVNHSLQKADSQLYLVEKADMTLISQQLDALTLCISEGLILSTNVIEECLEVTLAKMSFKNEIGFNVDTNVVGDFILEINPKDFNVVSFLFLQYDLKLLRLGECNTNQTLSFGSNNTITIQSAKQAWENGLREKLNGSC